MATMNRVDFVIEASQTILNHITTTGKDLAGNPIWSEVSEEDRAELREHLGRLFDVLDKDDFYIGRRGFTNLRKRR